MQADKHGIPKIAVDRKINQLPKDEEKSGVITDWRQIQGIKFKIRQKIE
jgi:hypothetical protein